MRLGVSRSRTITPSYGHLTLSGAELEEVKSKRILGVTLDSKLTFKTHFREVVQKAAKSLGVALLAFDCHRVVKSYFNAFVLSNLEYFAPMWMSSVKSHLGLVDCIVRSAERSCEGEFRCVGKEGW